MVLKCEDIWREVSNYIDGDVDPQLKVAMEQHIAGCRRGFWQSPPRSFSPLRFGW